MRIAVIDSGVHAAHPHVNGVAGGVSISPGDQEEPDYTDRLGHGTAVTAAIKEKAPHADLFAVRIFHESLSARIETLIAAIDWAVRNRMDLVNMSLGTNKATHEEALRSAVDRAIDRNVVIIAAGEDAGVRWLPGSLPGVVPVALDWECPRDEYRTQPLPDGRTLYRASGYPRPIP